MIPFALVVCLLREIGEIPVNPLAEISINVLFTLTMSFFLLVCDAKIGRIRIIFQTKHTT
jgi:hypothetical protein